MSKIKRFIRYFLIFTFLCTIPIISYADESTDQASIKLEVNLTTGTSDGSFDFSVKEVIRTINSDTGSETISYGEAVTKSLLTESGTKSEIIGSLKANTEYVVELAELSSAYEFVSLESGTKIITNSQTIYVMTGQTDSVTTVKTLLTTKGAGMETNKTTQPIPDPITGQNSGKSILSLSVTGKANTTVSTHAANILIIYDTSQSMSNTAYVKVPVSSSEYNPSEVTYYSDSNGSNRLYWVCNSMTQVCALRTGRTTSSPLYEGDVVYRRSTRAAEAQKIVLDFAGKLLQKNANLAMVSFDKNATERKDWTNTTTFLNVFNNTNGWYSERYTNWESGFRQGITTLGKINNNDPTYIVFITDGEPTRSEEYGGDGNYSENHYKAVLNEIRSISGTVDTIYGVYAFGRRNNNLDDLIYYANACKAGNCQERPASDHGGVSTATVATENYYTAEDANTLEEAIESIFTNITQTAGFSNVSIEDGTTSQVKVTSSSGQTALLEVNPDPSSFGYWLSMPVTKDGNSYKITRKHRENGTDETIIFTQGSGNTIYATWGDSTFTMEGTIDENNILKYKWTGTSFYDFDRLNVAPPTASYNTSTGQIDWDLSTLGKLINDVTYTVDFEVWPSQYTQDLIADLMNNPEKYDKLEDGIKDYIVRDGNTFTLRTNTKALVSYTDSSDNPGTTKIQNPPPIGTNQDVISVKKVWPDDANTLDPDVYNEALYDSIELYIKRDAEILPDTITLNKVNNWERNLFLSMGIIKQTYSDSDNTVIDSVEIIEKGHDYSFVEKDYHWNLEIRDNKIVHPMLINGVATTLVKSNKSAADIGIGTATFKVYEGVTYYQICNSGVCSIYEVDSGPNAGKVIADNYRRSNVNIKKEVIGDYDGTDEFEFTLKVKGTEDLWFSVADVTDPNNTVNIHDATVVGARLSIDRTTGDYYYVIEGVNLDTPVEVKVSLRENWNIRFTNIPKTTIIEVVESNIPTNSNVVFDGIEINDTDSLTKDVDNLKVTGILDKSNTQYEIVFQNRYLVTDVSVTKEWKDETGADITANIPNSITVELVPSTGSPVQQVLNEENNWTYTWSGLTKYVWNNTSKSYDTITYSVREIKIDDENIPSDGIYPIKNDVNAIIGRWIVGDSTSSTTLSGIVYTITNTWKEASTKNLNFAKIAFGTDLDNTSSDGIPTLSGAVFKLYRYSGNGTPTSGVISDNTTGWSLIGTSDGSGRFSFDDLYAGEYRLVEVTPPNGYILSSGQWKIVITENSDGTLTVSEPVSIENPTAITLKDNTYYVYNQQVPDMPETGARGIVNYNLVGLILMVLGCFFLILTQKEKKIG